MTVEEFKMIIEWVDRRVPLMIQKADAPNDIPRYNRLCDEIESIDSETSMFLCGTNYLGED